MIGDKKPIVGYRMAERDITIHIYSDKLTFVPDDGLVCLFTNLCLKSLNKQYIIIIKLNKKKLYTANY